MDRPHLGGRALLILSLLASLLRPASAQTPAPLDEKTYGPATRKAWIALTGYINPDGAIRDVCRGTDKLNDHQYYLTRERVTGDLHGQAPLLWCATALLRDDAKAKPTNQP